MLDGISPLSAPEDGQEMVLLLLSWLQSLGTKSLGWCQVAASTEDPRVRGLHPFEGQW